MMKNKECTQRRRAWLLSVLTVLAIFALILRFADMRYMANDDHAIQHITNGHAGGFAGNYCKLVNWLVMYPLYWLSRLDPTKPWFAYMQVTSVLISLTVCHASLMHAFIRERKPLWAGYALSTVMVCCIGFKYLATPTFTLTAALAGAAAVMKIMGTDPLRQGDRGVIASMLAATALAAVSYGFREIVVFITLPYCVLAFAYIALRYYVGRRSLKPMIISAGLVVLVFAVLMVSRQAEIRLNGLEEIYAWQQARGRLTDYPGVMQLTDAQLAKAGWSRTSLNLMMNAFFLDPALTTDSMQILIGEVKILRQEPIAQRLMTSLRDLAGSVDLEEIDYWLLFTGAIAAAAAVAFSMPSRKRRALTGLIAATLGLCLLMLLYLGYDGKLPTRALLAVLIPAAAMLYATLPAAAPDGRRGTALLCAALVAIGSWALACVPGLIRYVRQPAQQLIERPVEQLESYALAHPDQFLLCDVNYEIAEVELFQHYDSPADIPGNIFFLATWTMKNPEIQQQLAAYGLDIDHVRPQDLMQQHIYFIRGANVPYDALVEWSSEKLGAQTEFVHCFEWEGFHFFQLRMKP